MARCGCGDDCNCDLQEGPGIDIAMAGNTYWISFNGGEVAGPGIAWDPSLRKLSTRLAPGGGLEFDANGAMRTTSGGEPGGGPRWPTIADLETRGRNVVIGALGAGYFIKPESLIRSYQFGQELGLDAMHVAVRFLSTGHPVVHFDEILGRASGTPGDEAYWTTQQVQDQDMHRWTVIPSESGMWNPRQANQPGASRDPLPAFDPTAWDEARWPTRAPSYGWFGYLEPGQWGLTFLADVLREVGGRTPLILDLRFPARDPDTGQWLRGTPAWRTDVFLRTVLALIRQHGLTNSVVVTSTETEIPAQTAGQTVKVLDYFANAGVRVGPYLESKAAAAQYPPADPAKPWPKSWTWVFCSLSLDDDQIAAYKNKTVAGKPLNTIAFVCNRQIQWAQRIRDKDLLGGISGDPLYAAALIGDPAHPLSGRIYRRAQSRWDFNTIDHGLIPPYESVTDVHAYKRGHHQVGLDRTFFGPEMRSATPGATYYTLHGWLCPMDDWHDNWSINFVWGYDQWDENRSAALAFAFCRTTDMPFVDWRPAPADDDLDGQSGYVFMFNQFDTGAGPGPNLYLFGFEGGKVVTLGTARTLAPTGLGGGKQFRIGVNPKGIRIRAVAEDGMHDLITVTTDLAKAHRGPYVHFGRNSPTTTPWYGWMDAVAHFPTGGTADGPQ